MGGGNLWLTKLINGHPLSHLQMSIHDTAVVVGLSGHWCDHMRTLVTCQVILSQRYISTVYEIEPVPADMSTIGDSLYHPLMNNDFHTECSWTRLTWGFTVRRSLIHVSNVRRASMILVIWEVTWGHTVGGSLINVGNVKRVSVNLVTWSLTWGHTVGRSLIHVSNVRRLSINLITWHLTWVHTVGRSLIHVFNVRRGLLNLGAWRTMPEYTVGRNLTNVSGAKNFTEENVQLYGWSRN